MTSITALALSDPCQSKDKVLLEVGGVWGTQDRVGWATLSVKFPRLVVLGTLAFQAHGRTLLVEVLDEVGITWATLIGKPPR